MEVVRPSIEMKYGVSSSLWTKEEMEAMVSKLGKVDPFHDDRGVDLFYKKGVNLEGYPLVATLHYMSPNWMNPNIIVVPYPEETSFEAQFLPTREVRVKQSLLNFYLTSDEESDMEDLSKHLLFEIQFGNGEKLAGEFKSESNGDLNDKNTLMDNRLLLPGKAEILSAMRITFNR